MTAFDALALAHWHRVRVTLDDGRLAWESCDDPPEEVLAALSEAKAEIVAALRYRLDDTGALIGDGLLDVLGQQGFKVRRYGSNAALDNEGKGSFSRLPCGVKWEWADRQARYALAVVALSAPDHLLDAEDADDPLSG